VRVQQVSQQVQQQMNQRKAATPLDGVASIHPANDGLILKAASAALCTKSSIYRGVCRKQPRTQVLAQSATSSSSSLSPHLPLSPHPHLPPHRPQIAHRRGAKWPFRGVLRFGSTEST
jgi:hypothetical protein